MDTAEAGRKGGLIRAGRLTPEERRRIATKASKAAAEARRKEAKARKKRKFSPTTNVAAAIREHAQKGKVKR